MDLTFQPTRKRRLGHTIDLFQPALEHHLCQVFERGEISLHVGKKTVILIHTPGHSSDSISAYVREDKVLFAGDLMMPVPYIVGGDREGEEVPLDSDRTTIGRKSSNSIQVTLTATNGTLNLSGTRGLSFTPPADGTDDATMTFTGTIADINAALEGATFVAAPGFIGAASVQITTNDQGNTGTGGALGDTDSVAITVQAADQKLWLTFENDEGSTGSSEIPSMTGGDVVTFSDITQLETSNSDPLASMTSGTLAYGFNLDTVLLSGGGQASDGNTTVSAVHFVTGDIQVGSNPIQLQAGDLLLSTAAAEILARR